MSDFEFRIRFNFLDGDNIAYEKDDMTILERPDGFRLRLKSGAMGAPIKETSRVALIGGPYSTKDEAEKAALEAKRALLIWAVSKRFGINFGDGKPRGGFTKEGIALLSEQHGIPFRNDIHGIDVFEKQENLQFILFEAQISVGKEPTAFIESIAENFQKTIEINERQTVSSELYCSSFFDVSFRSRLVTLINSIEALLEPPDRSPEAILLVEELRRIVIISDIDDQVKNSLNGSIRWLRKSSIGQTGKELSYRLLKDKIYLGKTAPQFFTLCYGLRSQIIHEGSPKDSEIDLLTVTNELQKFVGDLLLSSLAVQSL